MNARTARVASLAIVGLLASPPSAVAFHDNDTPLLFSVESTRPMWVSYLVSTDGAKVVTDVEAYMVRGPMKSGGGVVYDEQDRVILGFDSTGVSVPTGLYVDATPVPGYNVHVDQRQPEPESPLFAQGLTINDPDSQGTPIIGKIKILMWMAGETQRVTHALRGDPGVSLIASKSGTRTYIHGADDLSGTATVGVGAGGVHALLGARANVETSVTEDIANTLIGVYAPAFTSYDQMSMDTPSGPRTCPCSFLSFTNDDPVYGPAARAGSYTYRLTGAGVAGGFGEILLSGVDAALPEEADLGILRLEAFGPAQLAVGQSAAVILQEVIANAAGFAPMDAGLTTTAAASSGVAVDPGGSSSTQAGLGKGEVREAEETFTVTCLEAGSKAVTFDSVIRPTDPGDADPNPTNDAAQATLNVECVA